MQKHDAAGIQRMSITTAESVGCEKYYARMKNPRWMMGLLRGWHCGMALMNASQAHQNVPDEKT